MTETGENDTYRDSDGDQATGGAGSVPPGLAQRPPQSKGAALSLLILCEVLALSLWFSSTAVIPSLKADFGLDDAAASLISSMVSVGFVLGTLISASLGLADRLPPVRFFAASAMVAATANAAIIFVDPTSWAVPALRLVVGLAMAGIYPVGMKLAAGWAKGDMGFLVGTLVGALTLGSALPHLINIAGGLDWRLTLAIASGAAVTAGVLILFVRPGPAVRRAAAFRPQFAFQAWTKRSLRLANLGYFGHMWELYALWSWTGVFLLESFRRTPGMEEPVFWSMALAFATVASGAIGCIAGGVFADRLGRTTLTMLAMGISGTCALASGFVFGMSPWIVAPLFILWGISVVADSAQFSSSVMELSDPWLIGTMVTVQTCLGFLLTVGTIHLVPMMADWVGWQWSFAFLAIGPYLGVVAMGRLRAHPDAVKLAGGRR
ncbi:MFS transporter [Hwanghaeella grinnelliae]|uniref:MFS transporter n=1 Tax=Hwanghaeella grinnelliae TaxID=2500179 RepID=A0A437QPA6_9PROT|nr:MFS transporter [Hwanghaeella grinnelliae]RVU36378.1 MFS transporter [Hwanghaeella grinnelliae]